MTASDDKHSACCDLIESTNLYAWQCREGDAAGGTLSGAPRRGRAQHIPGTKTMKGMRTVNATSSARSSAVRG